MMIFKKFVGGSILIKKMKVQHIILLALIAIFFGVIYWVIGPLYNVLTALLAPFGWGPAANDILEGVWVMAGPLVGYLFRIPGAAILGETLSSVVEMFIGSQFGAAGIIAGLLQGFGAELGYTLTGYKVYNWISLSLSVVLVTIVTFGRELFFFGYNKYAPSMLIVLFIIRLISTFIFSGVINKMIINLLKRAKVLNIQ